MYDEGLLDRQEFLSWFIELVEKKKQTDDTILKLTLTQFLQNLDEMTMSAGLSRRLAYACSKRIAQMCNESGCASPCTQSPMLNASNNGNSNNQVVSQNPLAAVFAEFNNCPKHRGIILSLSACLQVITMNSPSAWVWNNLQEGKSFSPYCGSPLNLLPCAPSCLPMPPSEQNQQLLKELSIVESQLTSCSSSLSGIYTTSLCLCIMAIFRKYHSFLLISEDPTFQAFEGLIGVVKHVCNPYDCSSSERCILAYLYDVYTSCTYLKNKFQEMFSNAYNKIRFTLYAEIKPNPPNLMWDPTFMIDFLETAKSIPIEQSLIEALKQPANRYSFVCNTMLNICKCTLNTDRLNEMSVLCAELTAKCNSLSAEWLGVLKALCCSSNHNCGYLDVLTQIDVSDLSFHDNLAVFSSILIAQHCFFLQDLIGYVALPSLVNPAFAGGRPGC